MPRTATRREALTAERILDVAERLVQTRGFNSVSYANIAAEVGITTAGLHYHFPGKAELGRALVTRYAERFSDALRRIDQELPDARTKLGAYADLYREVLKDRRMCLGGILAAEYQTLPKPMHHAVTDFFDETRTWLVRILSDGLKDSTLNFRGAEHDVAQSILSTLEGAMLIAGPYTDVALFDSTVRLLLANLDR